MRLFTLPSVLLLFTLTSASVTQKYTPLSSSSYLALSNPARGLVYQQDIYLSQKNTYLTSSLIRSALASKATPGITLIQPIVYLDSAISGRPLTPAELATISTTFSTIADTVPGTKAIVRFAYTSAPTAKPTEPAPDDIVQHISQLAPILANATGVLLTVQLGFIGAWGEGYYTTNFGNNGVITATQQASRNAVADALLAAVPTSIQLQMRTPAFKQAYLDSSAVSVNEENAYSNASGARIGHFDDCFLASATDQGTYREASVNGPDHVYVAQESEFVIRGGETCVPSKASLYACGNALAALEREHWSWLHVWNAKYVKAWKKGGCWGDIQAELGYQLGLQGGVFDIGGEDDGGSVGWRNLTVLNTGFASPVLEYLVEVLMVDANAMAGSAGKFAGYAATLPLDLVDIRRWAATAEGGVTSLPDVSFCFPNSTNGSRNGTKRYEMLLNIHDATMSVEKVPGHRILLGNGNMTTGAAWLKTTRLNRLGVVIDASMATGGEGCDIIVAEVDFSVDSFTGVLEW